MRLAIISSQYPFGAQESFLDTELRALSRLLDTIIVIPTTPKQRDPYYSSPAPTIRLGWFSGSTLVRCAAFTLRNPVAVARAVGALLGASRRPVIVKNLAVLPMAIALAAELRARRIDHVHAYWLSTPSTVAYIAARLAGAAFSSTAHLWDIYENNAAALKAHSATSIRTISKRGQSDLRALVDPSDRDRIVLLHVGIEIPPEPAPIPSEKRPMTLLCAANFVPKKGHRDLMRALATIHDAGSTPVRCILAGDGPLLAEIQALAVKLGLGDGVVFAGRRVHADLLREIEAGVYDAGILPSIEARYGEMEGIPVALMEMMAAGLPVISTRTGSIRELVDERCGVLVDDGDVPAISAAIERLAADSALRRTLGAAAREKIISDFNALRIAEQYLQLLREGAQAASILGSV